MEGQLPARRRLRAAVRSSYPRGSVVSRLCNSQGIADAIAAEMKVGKSEVVCEVGQLVKLSKDRQGVVTRETREDGSAGGFAPPGAAAPDHAADASPKADAQRWGEASPLSRRSANGRPSAKRLSRRLRPTGRCRAWPGGCCVSKMADT